MKLILENEFTWDGMYGLVDENGTQKFLIDARIEESGRLIAVCDVAGNELGHVKQKKVAKRPEYEFAAKGQKLGTITRRSDDYDVNFMNWFVSGSPMRWDFRVVDKHGDIGESWIVEDCLAIDIIDPKNALPGAILLMGLAGLAGDLAAEYSGDNRKSADVDDVIDTVEGIAGATANFGKKTWVALEKLYGLYEGPKEKDEKLMPGKDLHDVVEGVEGVADKIGDFGHKTMTFLDHLYGLDEEQPEDKER